VALVVLADHGQGVAQRRGPPDDVGADDRVLLDPGPLVVAEGAGLVEDVVEDADLADVGWSVTVSVAILRTGMLARWAGLAASALFLFNQGDILSTAIPGFPVWDLGGLLGSTLWGAWVVAPG
jgi:hypothetical protein